MLCLPAAIRATITLPVVRRHRVADAVQQHRGRIAGTVSVRAIGVEDADACVRERPEGIVSGVLVARQSSPLFDQQDARAMLQAEGWRVPQRDRDAQPSAVCRGRNSCAGRYALLKTRTESRETPLLISIGARCRCA